MNPDKYFDRPEISNSDLSWLKLELATERKRMDFTQAFRMGSLIDSMITEPNRINYYKYQLDGEQYTPDEFSICELMKKAFRQDDFCRELLRNSTGQAVKHGQIAFTYCGLDFSLPMRCKYDLWSDLLRWGGDIKSTMATSQKQFEEAVRYFDYDRQRVVYMSISDAPKDMIIGISKVNYKIFKVPITRDCDLWKSGTEKLIEIAFKWWTLFGEQSFKAAA